MMKVELPSNEAQRLAALHSYGILDTPREAKFDDIVAVVSEMCETPVSTINLIDADREWCKAAIGLDVREGPRDTSICAHTILQQDLFTIPDTHQDARFLDHPHVTGQPFLRFYAGAVLETHDGFLIGTLCVLDFKPRTLNERQERLLRIMAKRVMTEMALGREIAARKEAQRRQHLLNAELHHRVKNTIATVQAVVQLSLRTSDSLDSFRHSIGARISSLANTHTMLTHHGWTLTSFKDLVESELRPYDSAGRVRASGDDICLPSQLAVTLAMVVHELLTNATKFGALSLQTGRVDLTWTVEPAEDGLRLLINWAESGGPPVKPPVRRGFGTMLLDRLLAHQLNSKTTFAFPPEGVQFSAEAIVPHEEASADAS